MKSIYNLDNEISAGDWIREEVKGKQTFDAPQLSSGCLVKQSGRGKITRSFLGYFATPADTVYFNDRGVTLLSGAYSNAHGLSIIPENFMKVVALFTARRCITGKYHTWINDHDPYMKPSLTTMKLTN